MMILGSLGQLAPQVATAQVLYNQRAAEWEAAKEEQIRAGCARRVGRTAGRVTVAVFTFGASEFFRGIFGRKKRRAKEALCATLNSRASNAKTLRNSAERALKKAQKAPPPPSGDGVVMLPEMAPPAISPIVYLLGAGALGLGAMLFMQRRR